MIRHLPGHGRRAAFGKVGGRRDQDDVYIVQFHAVQTRVFHDAQAQRQVEPTLDDVQRPIGRAVLDAHLRIQPPIVGDLRHLQRRVGWTGQTQGPRRLGHPTPRLVDHLACLAEQRAAVV